jgi:hypothetical protein
MSGERLGNLNTIFEAEKVNAAMSSTIRHWVGNKEPALSSGRVTKRLKTCEPSSRLKIMTNKKALMTFLSMCALGGACNMFTPINVITSGEVNNKDIRFCLETRGLNIFNTNINHSLEKCILSGIGRDRKENESVEDALSVRPKTS